MIDGMVNHVIAPCTGLAPAVQHGYCLYAVRGRAFNIVIQGAEFAAYVLHIADKFREL